MLLLAQFLDTRWLGHEAANRLRVVDALLGAMSAPDNESLWTVEALVTAPWWEAVRVAARHARCSACRRLQIGPVDVVQPEVQFHGWGIVGDEADFLDL
jgi:hypothetical protein